MLQERGRPKRAGRARRLSSGRKGGADERLLAGPSPPPRWGALTGDEGDTEAPAAVRVPATSDDAWENEEEDDDDETVTMRRQQRTAGRRGLRGVVAQRKRRQRRRMVPHAGGALAALEGTCRAIAVCESFNSVALSRVLRQAGFQPRLVGDVFAVASPDGRSAFVFTYGVVVAWGLSEADEAALLHACRSAAVPGAELYDVDDADANVDDLDYTAGEAFSVRADVITLDSSLVDAATAVDQQLACSFALAQSIKLSKFEARVDAQIELNRALPEELAEKGTISLNSRELSRKNGRLFIERSEINLFSDILDTPGYFWENDRFIGSWKRLRAYLEVDKREGILNRRLDVINEMLAMLANEVSNRHAHKLELIVIWLIVIEIVLEIALPLLKLTPPTS